MALISDLAGDAGAFVGVLTGAFLGFGSTGLSFSIHFTFVTSFSLIISFTYGLLMKNRADAMMASISEAKAPPSSPSRGTRADAT